MKKLLLVVLVLVGIGGFARVYYMKSALANRYSLKDLQEMATEANKTLPAMIDQVTRLDTIVASERALEKRFTLVNARSSDIDVNDLKSKLLPALTSQSCQSKQSQNFYQSGVSEVFTYFDMNGKQLASFTINKASCS